jgi:endonuclease YncB( thermonuclease family)
VCAALCLPAAAAARTGPCGLSPNAPQCQLWSGTVTFVGDGDTISVRMDDHKKDPPQRVRVSGIQAMEEYVYTTNVAQRRGECQAGEATARMESLIRQSKNRVELAAQNPSSSSRGRPIRQVRVKIRGWWRDAARILLDEGLVLPLGFKSEWALNATYSKLAQRAAEKRIGIWNSYYCGPGPEDFAYARVWVNSNPPGNDRDNPNGEWVKVRNLDPSKPLTLDGWWLRDSALRRYAFPAGTILQPGDTLRIDVVGDPAEDQPLRKSWSPDDRSVLYNGGGSARVSTFDFIVVGCDAWGTGSCPSK